MTFVLSSRDRRALLLGTGVILAASALKGGFSWVVAHERRALMAALVGAQLAEARSLIASEGDVLRAQSEAARRLLRHAPLLFESEAGTAALLSHLHEAARRAQVRVTRSEPLRDSALSHFTRMAARFEGQSDAIGVSRLLALLESGRPRVRVERFNVVAENPLAPPEAPEMLRVELVATAWTLRGR